MTAWLRGARPRALPSAVVPVLVGTACAAPPAAWWRAAAALAVAVALQAAVSYANPRPDGPGPAAARRAALLALAVAAAAGAALCLAVDPRLAALGLACVALAGLHAGGRRPLGPRGFTEASAFAGFGLAATVGSAYVQTATGAALPPLAVAAAVPVGALAAAALVAGDLRDLAADAAAGRRTLSGRLGDRRARWLYVTLLAAGVTAPVNMAPAGPRVLVALLVLPLAVRAGARVLRGARGAALDAVVGETARLQLAFGILLAAGLWRRG